MRSNFSVLWTKPSCLAVLISVFLAFSRGIEAKFFSGRVPAGTHEYPEISRRMVLREAIRICEGDPECAGFTQLGSDNLDDVRDVTFYKFIRDIYIGYQDIDWLSYRVDRDFATYTNQVPFGTDLNNFTEVSGTQWSLGEEPFANQLKKECTKQACTAVAINGLGSLRIYHEVDLTSFQPTSEWTTLLNLRSDPRTVHGNSLFDEVDFCCPPMDWRRINSWEVRDEITRVLCDISEKEFTEKFIRTSTPVIFEHCDYKWLDRYDVSPKGATLMYHDNKTTPKLDHIFLPRPGFTHVQTPNSDYDKDDIVLESFAEGWLRSFNRMRNNYNCQKRESNCSIFETFPRPAPIPEDLYVGSNFQNDLDWVIISQEGTGSHPHNDPDLTGAWNVLINGQKWWIMFPRGVDAKELQCDPGCSPDMSDDEETFRWFNFVLPQLRKYTIYGQRVKQFVQHGGESLYLPHGYGHAILNIRDNVAVTENYLFVDSLPELMSKIALNEIDDFRPGWEEIGFRHLYYELVSKKDRKAMREHYDFALRMIEERPIFCNDSAKYRADKWRRIFGKLKQSDLNLVTIES